jgi:hypothetical protein
MRVIQRDTIVTGDLIGEVRAFREIDLSPEVTATSYRKRGRRVPVVLVLGLSPDCFPRNEQKLRRRRVHAHAHPCALERFAKLFERVQTSDARESFETFCIESDVDQGMRTLVFANADAKRVMKTRR